MGFGGCARAVPEGREGQNSQGISLDPKTGVPYATTYQYPLQCVEASDFGFAFGSMNTNICMARDQDKKCVAYGYHLARDSRVDKTPYGTEVVAPADGIVRITTDVTFRGYGSTSSANANYFGCVIVLEHEFPNGDPITTLLGHVQCESGVAYSATGRSGNPPRNTVVHRGQYLGHIGHYWYGAGKTTDWHHVHWGIRKGKFSAASYTRAALGKYARGYANLSEFSVNSVTHLKTHAEWTDPFSVVQALGDPALTPAVGVRHHPPGSLLEDADGKHWLVAEETKVSLVPQAVMLADRYDASSAVRVSAEELACYDHGPNVSALGPVTAYQRPGTSTVVMAYEQTHGRYDVIRWEALLSWGLSQNDLTANATKINLAENTYADRGYRRLRPGTLVKADESSEVTLVTPQSERLPIATGEVFEALGYDWKKIVSLPAVVLDQVAGQRSPKLVDFDSIHHCLTPPPCPDNQVCAGGDDPIEDDPALEPEDTGQAEAGVGGSGGNGPSEICNGLDDDGNGQADEIFMCQLSATDGPPCVTSCNTSGMRECVAPACSWGACHPFPESCANTLDDDCNGFVDCADPVCVADPLCVPSQDAGSGGSSGSGGSAGTGGSGGQANSLAEIHFTYVGPAVPGNHVLWAWWQPPTATPRTWAPVTECADSAPGDGKLECVFQLPHGTGPLEFQVALPDNRFWGDESCNPTGGCGQTIGSVHVADAQGDLLVTLVPNNPDSQPYYNGYIAHIQ
jgi:hypothetical protein